MKKNTRHFLLILCALAVLISVVKLFLIDYSMLPQDLIAANVNKITQIKKTDYSFAVMGDNKNSISTFRSIITKINDDPSILFTLNTGDMVFDGATQKYLFFLKQFDQFRMPVVVAPGNHDVADEGTKNYKKIFGPFYYSFHLPGSYFISLDDSDEKRIDEWQMQWLKGELKKSEGYKNVFVFMHVPPFDPRVSMKDQPGHSMKDTENAKKLLSLLKERGITMLFLGHIHGYFKGNFNNVPYTITGGGGAELLKTDPKHYFYHYIKVNVSTNRMTYKLVKMKTPEYNIQDRIFNFIWLYISSFIAINYWTLILVIGAALFFYLWLKERNGGFVRYLLNYFKRK